MVSFVLAAYLKMYSCMNGLSPGMVVSQGVSWPNAENCTGFPPPLVLTCIKLPAVFKTFLSDRLRQVSLYCILPKNVAFQADG